MERGNNINGDHKHSFRWKSRPQSSITCFLRCQSHPCGGVLFLKICGILYQSSTPSENLKPISDLEYFCGNRFRDMLPFSQLFANFFFRKWKSPFHLLLASKHRWCLLPRRPLWPRWRTLPVSCALWLAYRPGEGGLQIEPFDWLPGWQKLGQTDSVKSIDLIGLQAGRQ